MKITHPVLKFFRGLPVMTLTMVSLGSISAYGQLNNPGDQEIKSASQSVSEVSSFAEKAHSTEVFTEAKSYVQHVLSAAKETKTAVMNAERLLIEKENQISNSSNKELIENIKDQREEMTRAKEEATIAYESAVKASNANDLDALHKYTWEVLKASKKVVRQIEATQHYSSLLNDTKTN